MKSWGTTIVILLLSSTLSAQDKPPDNGESKGQKWKKGLADRSQRGTLHDAYQKVRGDSGKWNDHPKLQHVPPPLGKMSLDDWYDWVEETRQRPLTPEDDNWLLFKTKQLDDNDRAWIERIDRDGNQFIVVLNQAIWQGHYQKTFTYYGVFGVNLGKLPAGKYEAKWILKPLVFKQFEGNGRPRDEMRQDNWSQDERTTDKAPLEVSVGFTVVTKNP